MMDAPSFVLSGSDGTLVAQGVDAAYPDIAGARAALRSGRTPILVGALPFDVGGPAALMAPRTYQFTDTLPSWPAQPASNVRIAATVPTAESAESNLGIPATKPRPSCCPIRDGV